MKQGKHIAYEDICYNRVMFHIPEAYLMAIIKELITKDAFKRTKHRYATNDDFNIALRHYILIMISVQEQPRL